MSKSGKCKHEFLYDDSGGFSDCTKCGAPFKRESPKPADLVAAEGVLDGRFPFQVRRDIPKDTIHAGVEAGAYLVLKFPAKPAEPAATFTEDDWKRMAGSIIDTVHMTNEDYVNEKLVEQLKRYFAGAAK